MNLVYYVDIYVACTYDVISSCFGSFVFSK